MLKRTVVSMMVLAAAESFLAQKPAAGGHETSSHYPQPSAGPDVEVPATSDVDFEAEDDLEPAPSAGHELIAKPAKKHTGKKSGKLVFQQF